MKKSFLILVIVLIIIISVAVSFFVFRKYNKFWINTNPSDLSSSSNINSEYVSQIEEENNVLKEENQKVKDEYDTLKKTYEDLLEKYYEVAPTAFFTFDDGPSGTTEPILNVLRENNIKATFFVVGTATPFRQKMYKQITDEGHIIGIHSYWHSYEKIYASKESFFEDFDLLKNAIFDVTGIHSNIYRFPGGSNNNFLSPELYDSISAELKLRGVEYFDWNINSGDSISNTPSKKSIVTRVVNESRYILKQKRKTAIILFHDSGTKSTTTQALPEIINELKNMGYGFEPLFKYSYAPHFKIKYV